MSSAKTQESQVRTGVCKLQQKLLEEQNNTTYQGLFTSMKTSK
jgi:hypothetical protein